MYVHMAASFSVAAKYQNGFKRKPLVLVLALAREMYKHSFQYLNCSIPLKDLFRIQHTKSQWTSNLYEMDQIQDSQPIYTTNPQSADIDLVTVAFPTKF